MSPGTPNNRITCGLGFQIRRRYDKPLNREKPAEQKEEIVDQEVLQVVKKGQTDRLQWLESALMQTARGKVKASVIYNIIVHDGFSMGLDETTGTQMYSMLLSNLHLFHNRQEKHLRSTAFPLSKFSPAPKEPKHADKAADGDDAVKPAKRESKRSSRDEDDNRDHRRERKAGDEDDSRREARRTTRNRSSSARKEDDWRSGRKRSLSRGKDERGRGSLEDNEDARGEQESKTWESERRANKRQRLEQFRSAIEDEERKKDLARDHADGKQSSQDVANSASGSGATQSYDEWKSSHETAVQRAKAAEGARFIGYVLDLIRDLNLHARERWQGGALTMATGKVQSLKQELFRNDEKIEFEERLANFRKKKESGLNFLQKTIQVLQSSPFQDASSDTVLFLAMSIVCLPDRPHRIALHERLLTLKRQLEEGGIERKAGDEERGSTEATRQNISIKVSTAKQAQGVAS